MRTRKDGGFGRDRYGELIAIAALVAAGCGGSSRGLLDGGGSGGGSGESGMLDGTSVEADGPRPDPDPSPDPPHPICGSEDFETFFLTPQAYADLLDAATVGDGTDACDTGGVDAGGWSDPGNAGETGGTSGVTGSGGTSGTTGGPSWDELPLACPLVCGALICVDPLTGSSLGEVSCALGDPTADDLRPLTCCFSITQTGGRGHACIVSSGRGSADNEAVRWLERLAHSEAASVRAFEVLERELADAGAPTGLRARVRRAAADEVRHATAIAAIVDLDGGVAPRAQTRALPPRALVDLAIENAVEGCVAETAAAMVAVHQGRTAGDVRLREVMRGIGNDELRHAALAWDLHDWLMDQLSATDRAKVLAAAHAGVRTALSSPCEVGDRAQHRLGLPAVDNRRAILDGLRSGPWRELCPPAPRPLRDAVRV